MSLTKGITGTMGPLVRSLQLQSKHVAMVIPRRHKEWDFRYSSKEGVPREILTLMTQDYDFSWKGIQQYMEKSRRMAVREDHKFIEERHRTLGPDLATAHFLVKRGAKVKFSGRRVWAQRDKDGNMFLPNTFIPDLHLEAIDCTKMQMSPVAFDNMIDLKELRYLNFTRCISFDDWCLARLHQFQHSLEFLDLTDCVEVTHNGLACLHLLKKLQGLKLTGLTGVHNLGLMVLLLEEALPQCTIFGVDPQSFALPADDSDAPLLPGRPVLGCVKETVDDTVSESGVASSASREQVKS